MASPHADPQQQHHASAPPLLLAVLRVPFPGAQRPRALPAPDLAPLARRLDELAAAAAAHPLLRPLFDLRHHLSTFSQVRKRPRPSGASRCEEQSGRQRMVAMRQAACPLAGGEGCFAAVLGGSVAGMVVSNGVNSFLSLYNTVLVIRLVLTWFPNTPPAIVSPLSTVLAFLVLNALTGTAAALPAELPAQTGSVRPDELTANQRKWMRRFRPGKSQEAEDGAPR
ncbi:hypothetical protein CFC21_050890 [Triticum aestivum]|uniref:Uncharacterized protein n=2 Tax=Triticum aestivum TaxID=4565 RepID=A0A3B6HM47_WHEAT|nr:hypothetical protein CFC21_050890 [Triticum aestivum]